MCMAIYLSLDRSLGRLLAFSQLLLAFAQAPAVHPSRLAAFCVQAARVAMAWVGPARRRKEPTAASMS